LRIGEEDSGGPHLAFPAMRLAAAPLYVLMVLTGRIWGTIKWWHYCI
jgi:hypothetical protein